MPGRHFTPAEQLPIIALYVLSAGVVLAIAFDSVIDFIRQYILLNATTKIDIRIARATFTHLLSLPVQ